MTFCHQGEAGEKEEVMESGVEKKYTSSVAGASMNFINSIIGSGIIGKMPLSMCATFVK